MNKYMLLTVTLMSGAARAEVDSIFSEMEAMMRAHMESMEHMFKQFDTMKDAQRDTRSDVKITSDENDIKIALTVGDIKEEDISLEIHDDRQLKAVVKTADTIYRAIVDKHSIRWSAERIQEKSEEKNSQKMQQSYASYAQQAQSLPYAVDVAKTKSVLENGTLTLVIPRKTGTKIAIERK